MHKSKHMTAEQALRHPWILKYIPMTHDTVVESRDAIEAANERERESKRDLLFLIFVIDVHAMIVWYTFKH